ncbi:MAG: PadR family transcriptional regulator [Armatimonadetes bacterium]|nr:PadR family transcriptional regulator [Armatimonadota bacterium]NIM23361.1 PadR family transcriptional regulator [Armatimonadota bacterium]NIM67225.1 PadR family transcriptional regulator [Armatimonadota bacterium]NIO96575.1 PadR family transcriptional regulator [Armatimonadota bacterium]NIT30771.1 PadR family transcriptional regulator [Armatimonadota bacterium]
MDIRNIILGLLESLPMTGYELKQAFDNSLGYFSGASFGSIYPTLAKLEKEGLASVKVEPREGRQRKVYSITQAGRKEYRDALGGEMTIPPFRNEFLTRLFFFSSLKPKRQEEMAQQYIAYLEEKQASLKSIAPLVEAHADAYQKMCYRFGIRLLKQYIETSRKTLKELREYNEERPIL